MRLGLLILLTLVVHVGSAEIYKTTDKDGKVIYTDNPKTENAEKIELREVNSIPAVDSSPVVKLKRPKVEAITYEIQILSPIPDTIIPPAQRDLEVVVSVNPPALNDGVVLAYFMDGQLVSETVENKIFIKDIPVGVHKLLVEAVDGGGRSLGISNAVSVSVIRPSLKKKAP